MISTETDVTIPSVCPIVMFTNIEGKEFAMRRERVLHFETYCRKDEYGNEVQDSDKTFVNFESPNHKSKGSLHAVIDMPLRAFYEHVMRPAYEGPTNTTS